MSSSRTVQAPVLRSRCVPRASASASAAPSVSARSQLAVPVIKVCGVTRPEDALHAAQSGASLVGLILWPGSKRSVTDAGLAREIAAAAREGGAEPVAVFVDENAEQILSACDAAGVTVAQLHGDAAREALVGLPARLKGIFVLDCGPDGKLRTPMPGEERMEKSAATLMAGAQGWRKPVDWVSRGRRTVDWMLVDGTVPGSGEVPCDWTRLRVPRGSARKGWLLAGGLTPENVAQALTAANPAGVDVSSGVAAADGVRKSPEKVAAFCAAVRAWAASR